MYATINSIDVPTNIDEHKQEGVEVSYDALAVSLTDDQYVQSVNDRISRANAYWTKLRIPERRKQNYKYWVGDQVNAGELRDDLEKGADNAIFRNLETFIPIVSARTPELTVTPVFKNEQTRQYAQSVGKALPAEWELLQNMQPLVGRGVRNHQMNFIAVYQYGYDPDTDQFWTEEIDANGLTISRYGDFISREITDKTIGDLIEMFPNKKAEILQTQGLSPALSAPKEILDSPAVYLETWTDDMVGWKMGDVALDKMKNPHFDYDGEEVPMPDGTMAKVKYNHFKKPKAPFLFLVYFNRGIHLFDDTTLIEQAIGPQDWVNKRKRQIGANADSTNGHWVSSGDYISREEFDKITGGIDEKIWLENGMPSDGLIKITGAPLPDYIYEDLIDSRNVLDNLMGTHATTRGEGGQNKTATQDIMQKDQDYGRVDGYIRDGVEQFAKAWFEAMYHMYLVYRRDDTSIAIPEDDDLESDNIIFSRSRVPLVAKNDGTIVPVPLVFRVKQGSTLPDDPVSRYMQAKEMKDILRPRDFFKMAGLPNPRELEKNYLMWQNDPFADYQNDPDVQQMLMRKQQEAMAAAAMAGGGAQPGAAQGTDVVPPAGGEAPIEEAGPESQGVANAMRAIVEGQDQGLQA